MYADDTSLYFYDCNINLSRVKSREFLGIIINQNLD